MSIRCRRCGREYDVTLFSFGATVRCDCGAEVGLDILCRECADVDIAIAIERLRDRAEELFPGRGAFFSRVCESRFERLSAQWRARF